MPSHPDRVRRNYASSVPAEIRTRYAAGERVIAVSRKTYQEYGDRLLAIERIGSHVTVTECLAFKDAKVVVQ